MTTRSIINIDVQGQITCKMLCFIVDKTPYLFIFFQCLNPFYTRLDLTVGAHPGFSSSQKMSLTYSAIILRGA